MRYLHRISVALVLGFALFSFTADAAMTTQQRLTQFAEDLRESIQKNFQPSRRAVREQLSQDLNTEFNGKFRDLRPPKGWTLRKAAEAYISNLEQMFTYFPTDASITERNLFMKGCSDVYRHECKYSADYADPKRTLEDCYNMLLANLELGMKRLAQNRLRDARQEFQTTFNTIFGELMGQAQIPEGVNLGAQMADNVDRARMMFPIGTPDLQDKNAPVVSLLESAAKRIEQKARNYVPPKKK